MKRSSPLRTQGVRSSNPFDNLSVNQLAYIGAVAMAYNDLEDIIDQMCAHCLVGIHPREVLSRINGVDGKLHIIKHAASQWGFDAEETRMLCQILGGEEFGYLKSLRDAVVHARVFDMTSSVARTRAKQGKVSEVLLAEEALTNLFLALQEMRVELSGLEDVLAIKRRLKMDDLTDQHKVRLEEESRAVWLRVHQHRIQRRSLPPMPEFPEDKLNLGPLRMRLDPQAK